MPGYSAAALRGQINHFPAGQFVATVADQVVGYCATFRIGGDVGLKPHNWTEITGNGYASRHDHHGEWLYGMEVCVDPALSGLSHRPASLQRAQESVPGSRAARDHLCRAAADPCPPPQALRLGGGIRRAGDGEAACATRAFLPVAQRFRGDRHHPALSRRRCTSRSVTGFIWCGAIPKVAEETAVRGNATASRRPTPCAWAPSSTSNGA